MQLAGNPYRLISLLSIDVAVGAAVGAAFFARIMEVTLFPQAYVVLALTVWIIYTADHLLDARRLARPASTDRHLLHQRYFTFLAILLIAAILVVLFLVFFIRMQLMIPGLIMACLCAFYLLFNRWMKYSKELMATVLYSGGVLLPSLSLNRDLTTAQWTLVAQFVLIVLLNLLLFARMGYNADVKDRQQSFVTATGLDVTRVTITGLFIVFGLVSALSVSGGYLPEKVVLAMMALVLLMIHLFPRFFALEERYRFVGDSVFLLPLVVLAFF